MNSRSKVLLVGNGILRAFDNSSCDKIISDIMADRSNVSLSDDEFKRIPFPMRIVIATSDNVDTELKKLTKKFCETKNKAEQDEFYKKMLSLNIDAFLTTNYTFELENAVFGNFTPFLHWKNREYTKAELTKAEKDSSIYEYIRVGEGKKLFHIHGDAHRPNSVIIGHYYYGKLLAEIQKCIPVYKRVDSVAKKNNFMYMPRNWVEYFMDADVYIMGFGMSLSETDLWWLLCCKKRNNPGSNVFFYEPKEELEMNKGKRLLLEAYGVDVRDYIHFNGSFKDYYDEVIEDIREEVGGKQNEEYEE